MNVSKEVLKERAGWMLLFAFGSVPLMGSADVAGRYDMLSHQLMCTCGCGQILGECNHVGCPNSGGMLKTLRADVNSGMADKAIYVSFQQQYGPTSLASPMFTTLNQAAWVVPPAVLILGLLGALLLLRHWRESRPAAPALVAASPRQAQTLARIRRETEEL